LLGFEEFVMAHQIVEVIDRNGHVVHSYTVELDGADCVEAEFEEVALVLAEQGGKVTKEEHVHLRARCVK
jgi:hypothetical protein